VCVCVRGRVRQIELCRWCVVWLVVSASFGHRIGTYRPLIYKATNLHLVILRSNALPETSFQIHHHRHGSFWNHFFNPLSPSLSLSFFLLFLFCFSFFSLTASSKPLLTFVKNFELTVLQNKKREQKKSVCRVLVKARRVKNRIKFLFCPRPESGQKGLHELFP
jgi:hypothetical protein